MFQIRNGLWCGRRLLRRLCNKSEQFGGDFGKLTLREGRDGRKGLECASIISDWHVNDVVAG
jgi:hypothetical protein